MPKISILLPAYNGVRYIEEAIKSVLSQTFTDWELIILDDTSTDGTDKISKKYSEMDQRIQYIRNKTNLRLAKNLNKGLSIASGALIARIDEDDVWIDPDKLKKQTELFDEDNNYVLVGTSFKIVDEGDKHIGNVLPPTDDASIRKILLTYNPFCHSSVLFKKKDAIEIGGYDNAIKYGEDYDLWLKLGRMGAVAILPSISVKYLQRGGNMSSNHTKFKQVRFHAGILAKYGRYYPNLPIAIIKLVSYVIKG